MGRRLRDLVVNARQNPIAGKPTLDTDGYSHAVAQPLRANRWGGSDSHGDEGNIVYGPTNHAVAIRTAQTGSNGWGVAEDGQAYTLDGTQGQSVVQQVVSPAPDTDGVRAATGIPRGLDPTTPDGPRYGPSATP